MRRGGGVGRRFILTAIVPLAAVGVARHAAGEFRNWTNPAGGTFQDGANWSPAGAPTADARVAFYLAGPTPFAVRLNGAAPLQGLFAGDGDVTLDLGGYGLTVGGSATGGNTTRFGYVAGRRPVVRVVNGTLTTQGPAVLADAEGSAADVFLSGPAAHWAAGALTVGRAGAARLELSGGALLTTTDTFACFVGRLQGSRGDVVLTGPGTRWEAAGWVPLGGRAEPAASGGQGTLSVLDGAAMVQRGSFGIDLGGGIGSSGDIVVSGVNGAARSSLQANSVTVGVRGSGTMVVGDGARVETGVTTVGDISGSAGDVVVGGRAGGFDAELLPGFLRVGSATIGGARPYTGRVNVNAGGVVRVTQRIEIGSDARGTGDVTVDGGRVEADDVWLTAGDVNVRDGVFATRMLLLRSPQVIRPANFTQSGGLVTGLPGATGAPAACKVQIGDNGRPGGPYDLRGGTLRATVTVDPLGRFTQSGGTIDGMVMNRGTFTVEAPAGATATAGGSVVTGQFTNPGTVHVTSGSVHFDGGYSGFVGTFISDGGRVEATEFISGGTCVVRLAAGTEVDVSRRFSGSATNPADWDTSGATLHFSNASPNRWGYSMSAPGVDLGATAAGYVRNFAWEALHLDAGDSLSLSGTGPAVKHAVYVRELLLDGGTPQAFSISSGSLSPGVNVYYDANNPANAYLGGKTYAGGTGVTIMPVLPEPGAVGVLMLPAAGMLRRRRGLRRLR